MVNYTASRISASKVKYTFTITPSMLYTASYIGTGYLLTASITVGGISASGTLKSSTAKWSGKGPFSALTLSVECTESTGSVNQTVTFKVSHTGTYDKGSALGKVSTTSYHVVSPAQYKLTIYYNANGGAISSSTYSLSSNVVYKGSTKVSTSGDYGKTVNLYDDTTFGITKTGYTFAGWQTTSSGGTVFDKTNNHNVSTIAGNMTSDKTITLYAKWQANTLSISFNAAGGTITQQTGSNKWSLDANGNILLNGALYTQNYTYGSSGNSNGLPDGDNASHLKLIPPAKYTFLYGDPKTIDGVLYNTGYWNSLKSGKGVSLDWHTAYTTADICELLDISLNDGSKSITLYIMWTLAGHIYVNVNGVQTPGILYVNVNGTWRVADTLYARDSSGNYRVCTL